MCRATEQGRAHERLASGCASGRGRGASCWLVAAWAAVGPRTAATGRRGRPGPSSRRRGRAGPLRGGPVALLRRRWRSVTTASTEYPDAAGGLSVGRVVPRTAGGGGGATGGRAAGGAVAFPAKCDGADRVPARHGRGHARPRPRPGRARLRVRRDGVAGIPTRRRPGPTSSRRAGSGPTAGSGSCRSTRTTGEPSCVVRGAEPGTEPLVVRSNVSIADSSWHRVVCRRDADGISIEVDGEVDRGRCDRVGEQRVAAPCRCPGVSEDDDQFHGRVDDVFLIDRAPRT